MGENKNKRNAEAPVNVSDIYCMAGALSLLKAYGVYIVVCYKKLIYHKFLTSASNHTASIQG